jgi:hypothetical protein
MSADPVYMARLARYRQRLERQGRLGFAVKTKLQALAVTEAKPRNGELVTPPKPVAVAREITEQQIQEAAHQLYDGHHRHVPRGASKRKFEFII